MPTDAGDLAGLIQAAIRERWKAHWLVWEYLDEDNSVRYWACASRGSMDVNRAAHKALGAYLGVSDPIQR